MKAQENSGGEAVDPVAGDGDGFGAGGDAAFVVVDLLDDEFNGGGAEKRVVLIDAAEAGLIRLEIETDEGDVARHLEAEGGEPFADDERLEGNDGVGAVASSP